MNWPVALCGVVLILLMLRDAFEAIVLPRRPTGRLRVARYFYRFMWFWWAGIGKRLRAGKRQQGFLSYFGPLSLLLLLGFWAAGLVTGFALVQSAQGHVIQTPDGHDGFSAFLYFSGTTFFTLGLGDVVPKNELARVLAVVEAGTGLGFLAVVIGYIPVIYGAFSKRESTVSLLDARGGSPPTAGELLHRHGMKNLARLGPLLGTFESWAAELLESHISYPVLCYYRSQHDNQSWLAALTALLDTCALVMTGLEDGPAWQAGLTFAMARHAIVDLSQVLGTPPKGGTEDRLPEARLAELREYVGSAGVVIPATREFEEELRKLRQMYEPYVAALADRLLFTLPGWTPAKKAKPNWMTSAWERRSAPSVMAEHDEEHG